MAEPDTRYDFPMRDAVCPGEVWNFTLPVRVRTTDPDTGAVSYTALDSFAGYSDWTFYMLESLGKGPTEALLTTQAYFKLTVGSGITVGTAPDVEYVASAVQTATVVPGERAYEQWATINGSRKRMAFGTIPVIY